MDQSIADTAYSGLQAALICILEEAHDASTRRQPGDPDALVAHARHLKAAGQDIARLSDAMAAIASRRRPGAD